MNLGESGNMQESVSESGESVNAILYARFARATASRHKFRHSLKTVWEQFENSWGTVWGQFGNNLGPMRERT